MMPFPAKHAKSREKRPPAPLDRYAVREAIWKRAVWKALFSVVALPDGLARSLRAAQETGAFRVLRGKFNRTVVILSRFCEEFLA